MRTLECEGRSLPAKPVLSGSFWLRTQRAESLALGVLQ